MTLYIAPIVEGQTEERCVERLLHRIWNELLGQSDRLQVLRAFRGKRDKLVHDNGQELSRVVQESFLKLQAKTKKESDSNSLIMILIDAEKDCPAELAPRLLATAKQAQQNVEIVCVMPKQMFENWIVAGSSTLGGVNGLPGSLPTISNVEDLNGEAWLNRLLRSVQKNRKYKKTADSVQFVYAMNVHDCRANSPSFDKLCRGLENKATNNSKVGSDDESASEQDNG